MATITWSSSLFVLMRVTVMISTVYVPRFWNKLNSSTSPLRLDQKAAHGQPSARSCDFLFCRASRLEIRDRGKGIPEKVNDGKAPTDPGEVGMFYGGSVACWNTPYGCTFSGSSIGLLDHFEKHCNFHAVCCSRCDNYVLRSDVVGHLKSGCTALLTENGPGTSSNRRGGTSVGDAGKAIGEMKNAVEKMTDEQLHLQSGLNGLLESAKYQTAEIRKALELIDEVRSSVLIGLEMTKANCKEQILRLGDNLSSQTMDIARSVRQLRPRIIHWYLEGWEKIKEEALVKSVVYTESEVQTLYGYAISQNIEIKKQNEELRLDCHMRIHASQNDDDLEWPFKGKLKSFSKKMS
ncbi:hypothetical protein HPB47_013915 [Ixodes persulcatus]|uniref:Uncharacterized protein n=1 Tax=Ixodes persulcatus TaxID=34615 RepID=A0AC60QY83_IXOPE|nr:hypothetical protein HPB47_013915 [Ixodes persulcatus]